MQSCKFYKHSTHTDLEKLHLSLSKNKSVEGNSHKVRSAKSKERSREKCNKPAKGKVSFFGNKYKL